MKLARCREGGEKERDDEEKEKEKEKEKEEEEEETLSFGQAVSPRIARPSERDPNCRGDNSTHT